MPSFHADPDSVPPTAAPSVPTLVKTAGPGTARLLSGSLTGSPRPAKIPVLRKLHQCEDNMCNWLCLLGTQLSQLCPAVPSQVSCITPVFNNAVATHTSALHSLWLPTALTIISVTTQEWTECSGRHPSVTPPRPPAPSPSLLLASSCSLLYYNVQTPAPQLHSSSPHSPALLFVLVYIFHVKKLMLQFFFSY